MATRKTVATRLTALIAVVLVAILAISLASSHLAQSPPVDFIPASTTITRDQAAELIIASANRHQPAQTKDDLAETGAPAWGQTVTRSETLIMIERAFGVLPSPESLTQIVASGFAGYSDSASWPEAAAIAEALYTRGVIQPDYPTADGRLNGNDAMTAGELRSILLRIEALYTADKIPPSTYKTTDTWTISIYMCGSDLESDSARATNDLEEITKVALPDNITVVIEAGGAKVWHNGFDPDKLTRLTYTGNTLSVVDTLPTANMGATETLQDFLAFCKSDYPADHTVLIMWGHGGGSVKDMCNKDEVFNDMLRLTEMRQALDAVNTADIDNPPFELIGFDACLMADIGVANALTGQARYLVASQEMEPSCGWYYTGFMQALADAPNMNGAQLGKEICDAYYDGSEQTQEADTITMAVIDLGAVPALVKAYDEMGTEMLINAAIDATDFGRYGRVAAAAQNYGGDNERTGFANLIDLGDFAYNARGLLPQSGAGLLAALDSCVLYTVSGPYKAAASGISCFYSLTVKHQTDHITSDAFRCYFRYLSTGKLSEGDINFVTELAQARGYDLSKIAATPIADFDEDALLATPLTLTDTGFALDLDPGMADLLSAAYLELDYMNEKEDAFLSLGYSIDVSIDYTNGRVTSACDGTWGYLNRSLCNMKLAVAADDYLVYQVPVYMNDGEMTTKNACSMMVGYKKATGTYEILGVRKGVTENSASMEYLRDLVPGDVVTPYFWGYLNASELAEEENPDPRQALVTIHDTEVTITNNTTFTRAPLPDGTYLASFRLIDIRNKTYNTSSVFITIKDGQLYIGGQE